MEDLSKNFKKFTNIFWEKVKNSKSIAILTHQNPDGDGFPATLALQEILKQKDIDSDIILEEPISDLYNYIRGKERSKVYSEEMKYQTVILVDCHESSRVGKCKPLVENADDIFTIDHHIENNVLHKAYNLILPECVSAGVIIFGLFEKEIDYVLKVLPGIVKKARRISMF